MILNWIDNHELAKECQLFVRPYFAAKGEENKFSKFVGRQNVIIDKWFRRSSVFRDSWDYSERHLLHFANLIKHSSIMINYPSTLTIDAAAFDKPIINLAFDGYKPRSYGESIARWYDSAHFRDVIERDGAILVRSPGELKAAINAYLENPRLHAEGRARLRHDFCYKIDGRSGEAIAKLLLNYE
jgi:CDP-glycerol glycerophosphotransferase (TagB/SpsB family)